MKIKYENKKLGRESLALVDRANDIIAEYKAQRFTLTLRQLYYQFVSRDIIPNTMKSYKRLGNIINDARMAGLISWFDIEDRTRNLNRVTTWDSPAEIMDTIIHQYKVDRWDNQSYRPEVWIEKEALVGVISAVCREYQVPYFACRGYNSQSEQWAAGRRMLYHVENGQTPVVFHLGDHDPSGIDMTRDNTERLSLFAETTVDVRRLALNWDQIEEYKPPPNPAKSTDTRYDGYRLKFGDSSWELDALEPRLIVDLVRQSIKDILDEDRWEDSWNLQQQGKKKLIKAKEDMKNE